MYANWSLLYRVKLNGEDFARGKVQKQHADAFLAGDEVLVDYGLSGVKSPCESFMDYGFVF